MVVQDLAMEDHGPRRVVTKALAVGSWLLLPFAPNFYPLIPHSAGNLSLVLKTLWCPVWAQTKDIRMAKAVLHFYAQLDFSTVTLIQPTDIRKTKALLKPHGFTSTALHQSALNFEKSHTLCNGKGVFWRSHRSWTNPHASFPRFPITGLDKSFFCYVTQNIKDQRGMTHVKHSSSQSITNM